MEKIRNKMFDYKMSIIVEKLRNRNDNNRYVIVNNK